MKENALPQSTNTATNLMLNFFIVNSKYTLLNVFDCTKGISHLNIVCLVTIQFFCSNSPKYLFVNFTFSLSQVTSDLFRWASNFVECLICKNS